MIDLPELTIGQQVRYLLDGTHCVNATVVDRSSSLGTLYLIQPENIGSVQPGTEWEFRNDLFAAYETERLIRRLRYNARCAEIEADELEKLTHKEPSAA